MKPKNIFVAHGVLIKAWEKGVIRFRLRNSSKGTLTWTLEGHKWALIYSDALSKTIMKKQSTTAIGKTLSALLLAARSLFTILSTSFFSVLYASAIFW